MASTDILLGRGVVTLDGDDVGLCSRLTIRHQVEDVAIATWDASLFGGVGEMARRSRVFVDLRLHELTTDNRAKILDLSLSPDAIELVWTGKNAMAADCPSSTVTLTVPDLVVLPVPALALIANGLPDVALNVSSEALRPSGEAAWYTLLT